MSGLRETATALARTGAHPLLSTERLFATERVAAALAARRIGASGERGAGLSADGVATLSASEVRRALGTIWADRGARGGAAPLVERALGFDRRGIDRAIVEAYLLAYPVDHPGFSMLCDAVATAAARHDWRWREVGERWRLWEGPGVLGKALSDAPDPSALLHEAGFVGRLADGAFVSAARAGAFR